MSRIVNVGAAQMGPIAVDESRESCIARMVDLIKQAKSRGCQYVVFPELALTTFFPRWFMPNQTDVDVFFECEIVRLIIEHKLYFLPQ